MAGGDARHSAARPGRRLRWAGSGLVVLVLASAVAAWSLDLGPRYLGWDHPSPESEPAEVAPPPGLELPTAVTAAQVAAGAPDGSLDRQAVRRAVTRLMRDDDLGRRIAVSVSRPGEDAPVFEAGPATVTPASTMKLLTTSAALSALGPDYTFSTRVVAGASPRDVVLVGGGDPLLASRPDPEAYPARADVATLAAAAARSLEESGRRRVRVGYDASLFSGPPVNPSWPASYVPDDVVSPISALWVDEGRERADDFPRVDDPALAAAQAFASGLERRGITVQGALRPTTAPDGATQLAAVESAPLAQLAGWVLEVSDNEAAEVLLRHVALAEGRVGSFSGGTTSVRDVLAELGVDLGGARILDGSGLSRRNRLAPDTLLSVLDVVASEEHPELRGIVTGLPVAGFTGSLALRFDSGHAAGLGTVRAKTGTLTGVHGLAGLVTDREGTVLSFAAVADRVALEDTLDARSQLDRIAAALAACRCTA